MKKIVGVLGSPQAIKISYSPPSYGELESDLRRFFGDTSEISRESSYPLQTILKNKEGSSFSEDRFLELYSLSINRKFDSVSPILMSSNGPAISSQAFQDKGNRKRDTFSAVMLKKFKWEFPKENLIVLGNHYSFGIVYRSPTLLLSDLQKTLDSENIEHQISTYNPHRDFNTFETDWK